MDSTVKKKRVRKIELLPIAEIARSAGIKKKFIEPCGAFAAKISTELLKARKKHGKYIVVSSLTPSPAGEGKTVTAIALSMALRRLKKKAIACIPQPSLSGLLGTKGPGTGGGLSKVFPEEEINLRLTQDFYAVETAHNLCAAHIDNVIFQGNQVDINPESITWKRVTGVCDRSLRNVNTGMGSKADGIQRKTGFDITGSSELMAILSLSENLKDLRNRVGQIVVGFTKKEKPISCESLKIAGAMTAILRSALKPSLFQTAEGVPCIVHGGTVGNLSVGGSSVVADKMALGLSDYAISETGFSADTGAEKFFDIKCRASNLKPDAVVLVCTIRALKINSGDFDIIVGKPLPRELARENISSIERGLSNLEKQIDNLKTFGIPVVVCINRFNENTEKEIQITKRRITDLGVTHLVVSDAWSHGAEGALELASSVIAACKEKPSFRFLYPSDLPVKDKIKRIAKSIYGAKEITLTEKAEKTILLLKKNKLDKLPICIAKTQLSLSHSPKRKGRPHGFKFPIEEITLNSGAGFITALASNIKTMPGLPKNARFTKIDINDEGNITGLL